MTKEQQDLAYGCLPKEVREEIKKEYQRCNCGSYIEDLLEDLFGHHNLTSDTEPEEMLYAKRSKVCHLYECYKPYQRTSNEIVKDILEVVFGDKCLPDKEETCMCVHANGTACKHYDSSIVPNGCTLTSCKFESKFPTEKPSVQVEPKFKVGDRMYIKYLNKVGTIDIVQGYNEEEDGIFYHLKVEPKGVATAREEYLEPYTEPETKPLRVGDKVKVKGEDKVREIFRILPDGRIMFGDKGNAYSLEDIELVEETKDMEEKELGKEDNFTTKELNRKALYNALCELESASVKVRKSLIWL